MSPFRPYLAGGFAFLLLGFWNFFLIRWWFQFGINLAAKYDVPERRRLAARRYPLVVLAMMLPSLGVLLGLINYTSIAGVFLLIGLVASLAPALVLRGNRWPTLKRLGYGRQNSTGD